MSRTFFGFVATLFAMATCHTALAAPALRAPGSQTYKYGTVLNGVSTGAAVASRTVTVDVDGYARLSMNTCLADANTDCALTVTCYESQDAGTTYAQKTSMSVTSGAATLYPLVLTFPHSSGSSVCLEAVLDIHANLKLKCIHAPSGTCAGGDTITAQWTAAVGR